MSFTVFVTGGAGYIGSHCVLELLQADYQVIAIDNFLNAKSQCDRSVSPALRRVEEITGKPVIFYGCDLLDQSSIEEIFKKHSVDCVIHLAALKSVAESIKYPLKYYKNNLVGAINLLQVMRKHGVFNMVFSSSCCVYGDPHSLPITEQHPTGDVTNVYGRTKHIQEQMLEDLSRSDQRWNVISLRYFNPVGAHSSGLIGEDPTSNFSNLMPFLAQVSVGNKPCLEIYGDDYDTPDGTGIRDYIHIMDLASGHVAALKMLLTSRVGYKCYNLGLGEGLSVRQLLGVWERVTGVNIATRVSERREGDVTALVCDATAAKQELDWQPKYTVEDMCRDAWRWKTNNPNGYQGDSRVDDEALANGNGI